MNLSSLQMMTQDCYSWKPREIKVCGILLEDTSVRGLTNSEFLCSQSYKHSCWVGPCYWVYVRCGRLFKLPGVWRIFWGLYLRPVSFLTDCYNYLYRMKALDAIRASGKGCSAAVPDPESSPGEEREEPTLCVRICPFCTSPAGRNFLVLRVLGYYFA